MVLPDPGARLNRPLGNWIRANRHSVEGVRVNAGCLVQSDSQIDITITH